MDGIISPMSTGILILAIIIVYFTCFKTTPSERLTSPLTVSACIFSLDEGTQGWSELLALLGEVRAYPPFDPHTGASVPVRIRRKTHH